MLLYCTTHHNNVTLPSSDFPWLPVVLGTVVSVVFVVLVVILVIFTVSKVRRAKLRRRRSFDDDQVSAPYRYCSVTLANHYNNALLYRNYQVGPLSIK